ncbi:MAG: hypothetical protein K2Q14_04815 [Gammaproteobacteria bacterium]|nr:hypothetical protein [Gammaproteobacteria bacterium]
MCKVKVIIRIAKIAMALGLTIGALSTALATDAPKDFHVKQQPKQQAQKDPCCPGPCCPDKAGGPVDSPSQQTAND